MILGRNGKWLYRGGINPRPINGTFVQAISTHTTTTRVSYTVPKARAAVLQASELAIQQSVAPTVDLGATVILQHTKADGVITQLQELQLLGIAVVPQVESTLFYNLPLVGGDVIEATSANASADGTLVYTINLSIIEFEMIL